MSISRFTRDIQLGSNGTWERQEPFVKESPKILIPFFTNSQKWEGFLDLTIFIFFKGIHSLLF